MIKETEHLFAMRFGMFSSRPSDLYVADTHASYLERGDKKRAKHHLRVGPPSKTHYFRTFRSGLWLGLALPAIAGGSYLGRFLFCHTRSI